jgi:hypothetical protein
VPDEEPALSEAEGIPCKPACPSAQQGVLNALRGDFHANMDLKLWAHSLTFGSTNSQI